MAIVSAALPPPVVVRVISSGPSWLTFLLSLLGTFLVGTATALLIQLYIVPKVEKRKRRQDRWERDVRELGELLITRLTSLADDLHAAQLIFREVRDEQGDKYDPALVARQARDAEQAMFAYGSLIGTQVDWLIGRILSINPEAQEIVQLKRAAQDYRMRAIFVRVLPEQDDRTDADFHKAWDKEVHRPKGVDRAGSTARGPAVSSP